MNAATPYAPTTAIPSADYVPPSPAFPTVMDVVRAAQPPAAPTLTEQVVKAREQASSQLASITGEMSMAEDERWKQLSNANGCVYFLAEVALQAVAAEQRLRAALTVIEADARSIACGAPEEEHVREYLDTAADIAYRAREELRSP